jgi:hypothetical protein
MGKINIINQNTMKAMINKKSISMKERIARIKTPSQRKEKQPMKVNTPKAIKYLTRLKRGQTPLVKKLHNILLAGKHEVITMEQFEKLLKEYPEVTEISSKGKQSFLNSKISTVQAYDNGSLVFTIILSEGKFYKFKKK